MAVDVDAEPGMSEDEVVRERETGRQTGERQTDRQTDRQIVLSNTLRPFVGL